MTDIHDLTKHLFSLTWNCKTRFQMGEDFKRLILDLYKFSPVRKNEL